MVVSEDLARIEANLTRGMVAFNLAFEQLRALKAAVANETPTKPAEQPKVEAAPMPPVIEIVKAPEPTPEPVKVDEPLVINDEWRAILDDLNHGRSNLFVTGGAGTGKSTLLDHYKSHANVAVVVTAPTGVAALRVGGMTVHRFFGFGANAQILDEIRELPDNRQAKYKAIDVLLVDEISMVRADLMDAIDKFMRLNGRNKGLPFGGIRVVMIGDLFQLPPVSKELNEKKWLEQRYGTDTPYFFHAECWRDNPVKIHQLNTIFRQKDGAFTDALNAIRGGIVTPEHLSLINSRVVPGFKPPTSDELWLTLVTRNEDADRVNRQMLAQINAPAESFEAILTGDFNIKDAPTSEHLELKPGAVVMFVKNDADRKWVNGTMGKVTSVNPLKVEVKGVEHEVAPETWEQVAYEFDEKKKTLARQIKGKFTQIPLKLAAAITVHKSQGQTFDQVIVDFGGNAFAAGQTYVALSRCRTLEGMVLRRAIQDRDLIVSGEVQKFMRGEAIARPAGQMNLLGV